MIRHRDGDGCVCDGCHAAWERGCVAAAAAVVSAAADRPHRFGWAGAGYLGERVGCRFGYAGPADLTAAVLLWWLTDTAGTHGGRRFFLRDVIAAAGPLWDRATENAVWSAGEAARRECRLAKGR
jgi:hypothetical protein